MSTPGKEQQTTIKRVFRYMNDMTNYAIFCGEEAKDNKEINVHGFFYFDWDGDIDHRW